MAKAKKGKKQSRRYAPKVEHTIPEGFVMPASANVPNWDFEKQGVLQGEAVSMKDITVPARKKGEKAKKTRLLIVREESGNLLQVWESAGLKSLFEELQQGAQVYIAFEGLLDVGKGKNPMKQFKVGYKNPQGRKRK